MPLTAASLAILLIASDAAAVESTTNVHVAESVLDTSSSRTTLEHTGSRNTEPGIDEDPPVLEEGKSLFRGLCSGCHGGAGRGGKGPDLTDNRWLHGSTDADIARVIENGVPGTTMKRLGESLKKEQIASLIEYIHSLTASSRESNWQPYLAGDPLAGKEVFFDPKGKAQCSQCHAINGRGGRIGPGLDRIASRRSPQYIMESILQPAKDIDPRYEAAQVITSNGKVISGIVINETNFSIQLREQDGRFHSFQKRDLEEYYRVETSLMPANVAEILTVKQFHDLLAFMMTLE